MVVFLSAVVILRRAKDPPLPYPLASLALLHRVSSSPSTLVVWSVTIASTERTQCRRGRAMSTTVVEPPTSILNFGHARVDVTPPVGIYHRLWGAARHDQATG